jgi:hypothetical protein
MVAMVRFGQTSRKQSKLRFLERINQRRRKSEEE